MRFISLITLLASVNGALANDVDLLTDITKISRYWGQISPYADNAEDHFGVDYVGLPDGCQIVSSKIYPKYLFTDTKVGISTNSPTPRPAFPHQRLRRWRK